ncbi:TetR/AcrR family transcriptional regulator [Actinomadura kijaniata]|uniref:TetR/AcrR family transcriptional regulator n=1 Tax=Actinomadura kijaniata TaxID=46161 RepID=UPI000830C7B2|nr:TetR/AcrR family transcriptional regulator C-terminal domain-containing protein [Actinomadura kijaniata]
MVRQPQINAQNRPPLTIERIIESALHIIDGQGLGRLTMRRLGDSLEVEAMAIYHHLPRGKEQLLDGLVAHVAAAPADATGAAGWRDALRRWAMAYRARLLEHAGVLPLLVTGRNPAALTETVLSLREILRQGGVPEAAAATAAHTLLGFVIGHAALEVRGTAAWAETVRAVEGPVDWDARFSGGLDLVLNSVNPG